MKVDIEAGDVMRLAVPILEEMHKSGIKVIMLVANEGDGSTMVIKEAVTGREYERYLSPPPAFFADHWPPKF